MLRTRCCHSAIHECRQWWPTLVPQYRSAIIRFLYFTFNRWDPNSWILINRLHADYQTPNVDRLQGVDGEKSIDIQAACRLQHAAVVWQQHNELIVGQQMLKRLRARNSKCYPAVLSIIWTDTCRSSVSSYVTQRDVSKAGTWQTLFDRCTKSITFFLFMYNRSRTCI